MLFFFTNSDIIINKTPVNILICLFVGNHLIIMNFSPSLFFLRPLFAICNIDDYSIPLFVRLFFFYYFKLRTFNSTRVVLILILDRVAMLSAIRRFFKFIHWLYLQYLLNTALYMLEPWERLLFSTLLFAILSTALYSALVFLPHHLRSMIQFYS
jgi:hypothetical protein